MTFLEIVNEVLFDRFSESRRESIKRYVNARYGRVWSAESWTFKRIAVTVAQAANDNSIALADIGIQRVEGIWRTQGNYNYNVDPLRPEDYFKWTSAVSGTPYDFTIHGDTIYLDKSPSSTESLIVLGEKKFVAMTTDGESPLIPSEFHMMLVHGAASEALRMENDPTWQGFEQDYQAYLADMKSSYLTAVRNYNDSYPSWPYMV